MSAWLVVAEERIAIVLLTSATWSREGFSADGIPRNPRETPRDVITMTSSHHDLVLQSPPMYRHAAVITSDFDNIWPY